MTSIFFYGTLLHPEVLKRVLGNNGVHLNIAPAVLLDFTRHHVKGCDYPAIAPYAATQRLFTSTLDKDQRSVRGTVVSGLTTEDIKFLDVFEGDEYSRQSVTVTPLGSFTRLQDASLALEISSPKLTENLEVETYVWSDPIERLDPELWSFDIFVKEKLWRWVGRGSNDNSDYAIVDERRALEEDKTVPPEFGHALLPQFCFHRDYVNLNHGSFGAVPRPVMEAAEVLSNEAEARPDRFFRRTYLPLLVSVRGKLARLLGAEADDIVMVPNATYGINTVLRNFVWGADDVLVAATTTYGAVSRTVQYIHDRPPHPAISTMNLTFPTSHATILKLFRDHLRAIPRQPGQKVVAIIDSIVSNPGCVLPWEKMVEICRELDVWSVVDAAHSIGQEVGIDLGKVNPDFWVSNCHKWLFAKRGCAVLYVPKRNQHIIQSSIPTSFGYVSPEDPPQPEDSKPLNFVSHRPLNFVGQFEWTGTIDLVPYLSVAAALAYRERLGGEKRINEYCHALALKGGRRLAQLLRTNVMDEDGSLTANMVNVRLPLPIPSTQSESEQAMIRAHMEDTLLEKWDCFVAVFTHDGNWWTRCSAQVWNELVDFEHVAKALNAICSELRDNAAQDRPVLGGKL